MRPTIVLAVLLTLPAAAVAQGQSTALLPWRNRIEQQLQQRAQPPAPSTDPALLALLQQISAQQQQILALLAHQGQVQPPQVIVLGGPPLQQIPLGGMPRQDIPLGGPPKQDIPLGTPPKQDVPLGGPPAQQIPLGGPPPQQIQPGEVKPPAAPPPGVAKPTGLQRYGAAR